MACNVVRALEDPGNDLELFKHGLGYAKWGDCLEWNDWSLLYHAPNMEVLRKIISDMLNKYITLGMILENPKTAEEWYNKTWGGWLKTSRKSKFFKIFNSFPKYDYDNEYYYKDYDKNEYIPR